MFETILCLKSFENFQLYLLLKKEWLNINQRKTDWCLKISPRVLQRVRSTESQSPFIYYYNCATPSATDAAALKPKITY